ncbi:MAG: hypothetical protein IKS54_06055 [Erysipelotrichaceae bacterium]|nr:hypothetical protein [Erysipelotrichaceae bacterium]
MYKTIIRLKEVRTSSIIEAAFDTRLSFSENFTLLGQLLEIDLTNAQVYDPNKKIFLDRNIALSEFGFSRFIFLHLLI